MSSTFWMPSVLIPYSAGSRRIAANYFIIEDHSQSMPRLLKVVSSATRFGEFFISRA